MLKGEENCGREQANFNTESTSYLKLLVLRAFSVVSKGAETGANKCLECETDIRVIVGQYAKYKHEQPQILKRL